MDCHQADAAQQAARRPSGERRRVLNGILITSTLKDTVGRGDRHGNGAFHGGRRDLKNSFANNAFNTSRSPAANRC
jgi:hypothetical protein